MNRSLFSYMHFLAAVLFIAAGCAKISSPTGGPKDIDPPVVVKDVPVNGSSNFTSDNFIVTFDEYIVLDKIADKFMVSPPLVKNPVISVNGKSLVVKFDEKLKDNTTYTFYFQDAIRDLNEGNPIPNFQYVFSTGSVVDSLSVTGNVYNATNLEAGTDLLVLLHGQLADSMPRTEPPTYITKTDKTGYFRINNVKSGRYKLYALGDMNNNKKYDLNTETFAFIDSAIVITPESNYIPLKQDSVKPVTVVTPNTLVVPKTGEYSLYAFTAPKKTQYLLSSSRRQSASLMYTFSLPLDTSKFDIFIPGTTQNSYFIEENRSRDTIKIWITDSTVYSREIIESIIDYPFTDTTGTLVRKTDTIPMRFLAPREVRGTKAPEKLTYTLNLAENTIKPNGNILLNTQAPLRDPDTSRIRLFETIDTVKIKVPYSIVKDQGNSCRYFINAKFKENSKYLLVIDSAALVDLYGTVSDSAGIKFSVRTTDSFGSLTLNIKGYDNDVIIQLLDNNETVVQTVYRKGPGKVSFPFIEKGIYRLKVIYDLNTDKKWTTGDYDLFRLPEQVSYYPDELNVKVNWFDLLQDWDIGSRNFKNQTLRKKPGN